MNMADTVTHDQVRAARLVADLASKWGVPIPPTLREIASAELIPDSTAQKLNGHSTAAAS